MREIFAVSLALNNFDRVTIRTAILKYAGFVTISPGLPCGVSYDIAAVYTASSSARRHWKEGRWEGQKEGDEGREGERGGPGQAQSRSVYFFQLRPMKCRPKPGPAR